MIMIGDVHGCFQTLKALIEKLPKDEPICFVGDLIDRGPMSRQTVDYVRDLVTQGKAQCVMGNHEKMMAQAVLERRHGDMRLWVGNGGIETLNSYTDGTQYFTCVGKELWDAVDMDALKDHAEWMMDELPFYLEFPDLKNEDGRYLVVSHSHVSKSWGNRESIDGFGRLVHEALWSRPEKFNHKEQNQGIYNVIGHTPREKARIRSFYANIDSGCFYKYGRGDYYHLTALQFPSMELFTQGCIDEVLWKPF